MQCSVLVGPGSVCTEFTDVLNLLHVLHSPPLGLYTVALLPRNRKQFSLWPETVFPVFRKQFPCDRKQFPCDPTLRPARGLADGTMCHSIVEALMFGVFVLH